MLVLDRGLEPPLPCGNMNLNHARLPIPPIEHTQKSSQISSQPTAQNHQSCRIMSHPTMQPLEPESSHKAEQQTLEPQNANKAGDSQDAEKPGEQVSVTNPSQAEHESIQRLTNFLCDRVFLAGRPSGVEEWATCWRIAKRIRQGFIKMERIKLTTPEYPAPEVLREIPKAWGGASNESLNHLWLKYVAMASAKRVNPKAEYERFYGPCLGDVVTPEFVIECGDTDPGRVECIYDKPMFFISLPYCEQIRNRRLHAFMFSMTEAGLDQCFMSPWRTREASWLKYCNEVFAPMWAAAKPQAKENS